MEDEEIRATACTLSSVCISVLREEDAEERRHEIPGTGVREKVTTAKRRKMYEARCVSRQRCGERA